MHTRYPKQVPEGFFLQYRIWVKNRLWKVDIWAIRDSNVLETKMREAVGFKERMTPGQRELVLQTKYTLMAPFGRTPVGSSYHVYKAVLDEGLDNVDEIISYIKAQGGNVDKLK